MYAFSNAIILTGTEELYGKALLVEGDSIVSIVGKEDIPPAAEIIDCNGQYVAPGLIDLQIYGGGGYLFSEALSATALSSMVDALVRSGTTSFLLTLATNTLEVFKKAIEIVKENPHPALLGLHFEGPYLHPVKRGAHPAALLRTPERKEIEALLKKGNGVIKMMTIAPELFSNDLLQLFADYGVVLSAGHSNATYKQAEAAFSSGVKTSTHLFNAMPSLHHRDPGLIAAIYAAKNVYASIIADGVHVDYAMVAISKKIMKERLFLITDAVEETSTGIYQHVKAANRFTLPDGTLSGSALTMLQAVSNCVQQAGIALPEAVRMGTLYPGNVMHLSSLGRIQAGNKADLIIFSKDFTLQRVVKNGKLIH